ncbi:hypothetical protein VA7868_01485 [Vibrio aerogenes CECT 7868]|uniref:Uncharacterized protein n=1 Tax=Vibrio aerogenes CECT 7868 TaxID=1216006 RepID=A0A1M5Y510_9VIBR|nr:hypothetical protein [Vibrio aerogenes]SHI06898.1 hypothetical protein VA7868_01485 [Vibrio aerogenes CECT 7868]
MIQFLFRCLKNRSSGPVSLLPWLLFFVLIVWGFILSVPATPATAQEAPTSQSAAGPVLSSSNYQTCNLRLRDGKAPGDIRTIQYQLNALYQDNSQFPQDDKYLNDGRWGPVTRRWLAYFCAEFDVVQPAAYQAFMESILIDLDRATYLNALYPNWRGYIAPKNLLHLKNSDIANKIIAGIVEKTSQPALQTEVNTPDSTDYYQLTTADFTQLSQRQSTLAALKKLASQQFEQRSELYNSLRAAFTKLGKSVDIDALITSQILNLPAAPAQSLNIQSGDSANSTRSQADSGQAKNSDQQTTIKFQSATPQQISWQMKPGALQDTLNQENLVPVDKALLKKLAPLQNQVFASDLLIAMAFKLAGLPTSGEAVESILNLAKKTGDMPQSDSPMLWQAPDNCGCQDSKPAIQSDGTFYGFAPYWSLAGQHKKKDQPAYETIRFSQLDRIGYTAAVIKPDGDDIALILPPNWQNRTEYTRFIQMAERYRSAVDLVVTTPKHMTKSQLIQILTKRTGKTDDLVSMLVAAVKQPLDKRFVNRMKPILSFGLSPVPTMGDGVTLYLDLSPLNDEASQQVFVDFIRRLKAALQGVPVSEQLTATPGDRYFLNLVIPVRTITSHTYGDPQNIYRLGNLKQLARLTNLIITLPGDPASNPPSHVADNSQTSSSQTPGSQTTSSQKTKQNTASDNGYELDEISQIRELQAWLGGQPDQETVARIFPDIVPVLVTADSREQQTALNRLVRLSSWNFAGAAYWPVPLSEANQTLVSETFFPETPSVYPLMSELRQSFSRLMNVVCPNRWLLRVALAGVFTILIVLLVSSVWIYPLRRHLNSLPFVAVCCAAVLSLMLVFIADPFFMHYKIEIVFAFMLLTGLILATAWLVNREGEKP